MSPTQPLPQNLNHGTMVGTGHRPDKLGGYDPRIFQRLVDLAVAIIKRYQPHTVVSGGALGWDQAIAQAAWDTNTPFHLVLPFASFGNNWPYKSQLKLEKLKDHAQLVDPGDVVTPLDKRQAVGLLHQRNDRLLAYLKDPATGITEHGFVAALWNGTPGGTGNTVGKAQRAGLPIVNFYPSWDKYRHQKAA